MFILSTDPIHLLITANMSNTKEQPCWPKCTAVPSAHVTCVENATDLELSFHRKAQVAIQQPEGDNKVSTLAHGGKAG